MSALNGHSSSANGVGAAITVPNGNHAARPTEPSHPALPKDEILALNIHQRIAEIKKRCTSLPKRQRNQDEGWAFAGHDQVIDSLRGLMAQFGVNVYQEPLEFYIATVVGDFILNQVRFEYEVVNADAPEDKLTRHNFGLCYGLDDKAYNKCSTISEKFFLMRLFNIATYDDPDANAVPADRDLQPANRNSKGSNSQAGRIRHPSECEQCGNLITFFRKGDEKLSKEQIIKISLSEHKKRLCGRCLFGTASHGKKPEDPSPGGESGPPNQGESSPPGSNS